MLKAYKLRLQVMADICPPPSTTAFLGISFIRTIGDEIPPPPLSPRPRSL